MEIEAHRRLTKGSGRSTQICFYWLAGKCYRKHCKFVHGESQSPHLMRQQVPHKTQQNLCHYWVSGNCVKGDRCRFLHSWSCGDDFTMLATLQDGHNKAVIGVCLPSGSDKLFTGSRDGTLRIWDCNSGQCVNIIDLGAEIGSLISQDSWVFAGTLNLVKAWNIQTCAQFDLRGPVGQVYAMVVGLDMLFAGAQDGAIFIWKSGSESDPFQQIGALQGHSGAVVSLAAAGNLLFSGSVDKTIRVWNMSNSECVQILNEHTDVVMSVICWNQFLLSCSLDQTVKIWVAGEGGSLEVTYVHSEEHGVLGLCGMQDAEGKPILFCSLNDNSVKLYELPSFGERGKIFAKKEVRAIQIGPGGIFFTGDGTGLVTVWKWSDKASTEGSSAQPIAL